MDKTHLQEKNTLEPRWRGYKILDAICAVLLVLCPILQNYQGLMGLFAASLLSDIIPAYYVNLADNMSITIMIVLAPYMALRIIPRIRKENLKGFLLVSPLLAFYLFKVIDHGTSIAELLQVALSMGYLIAVGLGCIDLKTFAKAATIVGCIASGLMIVQYVCYYIFGFHLQLVPTDLLLPSAEQWVAGAKTGTITVTGSRSAFYRPSAFFLEPSHLFIYCFPLLFLNLYKTGKTVWNWVAGVLISVGIILSTSGMGVAVVFGGWVLFAALWDENTDTLKLSSLGKLKHWLRALCVAAVLLVLFLSVPSINHSMARIIGRKTISFSMFQPEDSLNQVSTGEMTETSPPLISEKNAVSGRVRGALGILGEMNLVQWIIGCADTIAGSNTHMPGFMSTAYKYGIIGLILSYMFFAYGLKKFDGDYFWATVIWFVISFFSTHTHGMIYLLFYVMLLFNGHNETTGAWTEEVKNFFRTLFHITPRKKLDTGEKEE